MRKLVRTGVAVVSAALCVYLFMLAFVPSKMPVGVHTTADLAKYVPGKPKAAFFALVRNKELSGLLSTIHDIETYFNDHPLHHYPYVFVNDVPFTNRFKRHVRAATKSKVEFGLVPKEQWEKPSWINSTKAAEEMQKMRNVPYGNSESYRKMCRYQSGFVRLMLTVHAPRPAQKVRLLLENRVRCR